MKNWRFLDCTSFLPFVVVGVFAMGFYVGLDVGRLKMERSAVEAGKGAYVLSPDGKEVFAWFAGQEVDE